MGGVATLLAAFLLLASTLALADHDGEGGCDPEEEGWCPEPEPEPDPRPDPERVDRVHVDRTDRMTEQEQKLPITRKAGQSPRVILSLPASRVGRILAGDRVEAAGETQVSTCLKPNTNHTKSRDDCVGKLYGFDPKIDAYLALAPSAKAAKPKQVTPLTKKVSRVCTQGLPHRNHHCTLTVPWNGIDVNDPDKLACAPSSCRINLIVSAFHKKAKKGNLVAFGGIKNGKIEHKNKGHVAVARYRPGSLQRPKPLIDRSPTKKMKLVDQGKDPKMQVVYSVPVRGLRAGDALVAEGLYAAAIKHLPYTVRTRTKLVFGSTPRSTKDGGGSPAGKIADTSIELGQDNNFNCTQGKSGHKTPCPIRKVGILRVKNNAGDRTFYVNLIAAHGALPMASQRGFRKGDAAKPTKAGFLKVWRYSNEDR